MTAFDPRPQSTLRTRLLRWTSVLTLASQLSMIAVVHAEPSAEQRARATALFDQGKAALDGGNYKEAVTKLEESMRLEPADGTEINLALAYEKAGRLASAWTLFKAAREHAVKANRADREKASREHIVELTPKLSYLTVNAPAAAVPGLEVTLDGTSVGAGSFGSAFPIDPGPHPVQATAPGKKPWSTTVTIGETPEKRSIDVPPFEDAPASTATTPITSDHPAAAPSHTPAIVTFIAGGVFLAAGVGSFFLAKGAQTDRKSFCASQASASCPDDSTSSKVTRWETISYVSLGAAIVAAGVGVVLWTSSGSSGETKAAMTLSPTLGGAVWSASF